MWLGSRSITRRPIDIRAKRCIRHCYVRRLGAYAAIGREWGGGGKRCDQAFNLRHDHEMLSSQRG